MKTELTFKQISTSVFIVQGKEEIILGEIRYSTAADEYEFVAYKSYFNARQLEEILNFLKPLSKG